MKLIVGLGNPGKNYEYTRHNAGFLVVDDYVGTVKWSSKFNGLYYNSVIKGEKIVFLKPQSYMNLSGEVVRKFVNYYNISMSDLLIIHDDLDLEVGKYRLKYDSSSGGHNGIKSIIENLGTKEFLRLKIGIAKNSDNIVDYVLSKFSREELNIIEGNFDTFKLIIQDFIDTDYPSLMNKYNR